MENNSKLAAALVRAQAAAKAVAHDATNAHHRYDYTSAEAIIGEARSALNGAGLAVVMGDWNLASVDVEYTDGDGKSVKDQQYTMHVRFLVLHESGETMAGAVEVPVLPEKGRPLDKASFSALTYAESYYLRGLLCLPRVSKSDDIDQRDDTRHEPRAAARTSTRKPLVNKHAGACHDCGMHIPEGGGIAEQAAGKWIVRHGADGACERALRVSDPTTDEPTRPNAAGVPKAVVNADEGTCTYCANNVDAGAGWERDGRVIHAACAKALKNERATAGAGK